MLPKVGDRIRLVKMGDDRFPITPGDKGTVIFVTPLDSWTQIGVWWDSGRSLFLSVPPDEYAILA